MERPKRNQSQPQKKYNMNKDWEGSEEYLDSLEEQEQREEEQLINNEELNSIFFPQIECILWKKQEEDKEFYLVKYKGYSYLHLDWLQEEDITSSKQGKNRLVRFKKSQQNREQEEEDEDEDDNQFFDPSYVEVDRVLYSTDMFPVLHPKKALEM